MSVYPLRHARTGCFGTEFDYGGDRIPFFLDCVPSSLHLKIPVSKRIFITASSLKSLVMIIPVYFHLSAAVDEP